MDICKYSDILGKPGIGFHNHFGTPIAILDLVGTILIAYLISKKYNKKFLNTFAVLMILAIGLHRMFCVKTALNEFLFN